MDILNSLGTVLFTSAARILKDALVEAVSKQRNLTGAVLTGADLRGAVLTGAVLTDAVLTGADLTGAVLTDAVLTGADLRGAVLTDADLRDADLTGAVLRGKKVHAMRVLSGLYNYVVYAVVFEDGERWVRMGCLWYSLEKWEQIGIRKSNLREFPDDGSERSEERVAAFEFAKAAALRMPAPVAEKAKA